MKGFVTGVRRVALLAPAAILALLLPAPAHAADEATDAPPDGATLELVTANGSGCKPGTSHVYVDPDNNGFRAYFDEYAALVGDGIERTAIRRNCQFNLRINGLPNGYQYTVAAAEFHGFGHLSPGATGLQRTTYYFQGSADVVNREFKFNGPFNDFWTLRDRIPIDQATWSPCHYQRNANINTELRVSPDPNNRTPLNFMSMTPWEDRIFARFRLAWRRC
jgi:hypothetical protein